MLFIPPYWSHRVTALDLSISVNVFSDTNELLTYYAIQQLPLDFIKPYIKSVDDAVYAARSYLRLIAEGVMAADKVPRFLRLVFETRYEPLRAQLEAAGTIDFTEYCVAGARPKPSVLGAVREPAKTAAAMFTQMPKDIDQISLANYIEDIARALFQAENVFGFLQHCLAK
eukprot:Unigene8511_Nuclearia_a/m.26061 Unigene8511_Nuclearia_a/g.26061  ORF Unigene8511_Nuclearia_a/g.26061 Unigene8511_Nuclearia_a/m.26061 type:complete len:171 (+) Unigene8511_Nuclearia_a:352-864(+)